MHLSSGYVYTIPDSFFLRHENHTGYRASVHTSEHVQCFRREFCNGANLRRADPKLESRMKTRMLSRESGVRIAI